MIDEKAAAERWFLRRGLPAVLRPGSLVRRIWARSAPALAGLAVMMTFSMVIVLLTGKHTIDINGTPTRAEWFLLANLVLVVPVAMTLGWSVSLIDDVIIRNIASGVAVAVIVVTTALGGPTPRVWVNLLWITLVVGVLLLSTATGVGSIVACAVRVTASNLVALGTLVTRALPVVLLTVVVFFNTYVWVMASIVGRGRIWFAVFFLIGLASLFIASGTIDYIRPMLAASAKSPEDDIRLAGTPFNSMPDRPYRIPLSHIERANVLFVVTMTEILRVLFVSVITSTIFFVMGLILLTPELLHEWSKGGRSDGEFLGMTLPLPNSLIQVTMFMTALTFMYLAARVFTDEHRSQIVDPLIDDVRLTLVARDRYRAFTTRH
jgi:hypothetical protein